MTAGYDIDALKGFFHRIRKAVSIGFFPDTCFSCSAFIETGRWEGIDTRPPDLNRLVNEAPERIFEVIMAPVLCSACKADFAPVAGPMCERCGMPFISRAAGDHLCGRCISAETARGGPFIAARAFGQHSGALMKLVHAYKYYGKTGLGKPLGTLLHICYRRHFGHVPLDLIAPVPLHRQKLVKRGFDQVAHMLYYWPWENNAAGRQTLNGTVLAGTLLKRVKNTDTQTGLDRQQRGKNVKNAFAVGDRAFVKKKRILLVDDVFTTGATLEECALALNRAGAAAVYCLTLSRTL